MGHQDFEKYAIERSMKGMVADGFVRVLDKHVPSKPMTVLDHGCGDGKYFSFLSDRYGADNIFGCDISSLRIKRCREIGWERALLIDENRPLPYPDSSFDLVISDQVIEHILSHKSAACISELHRVLRTGGKLVVMTPNYPIKRFYDIINAVVYRNLRMLRDDPTHVTFYDAGQLKDLLEKCFGHIEVIPTGGILFKLFPAMCFSHKLIAVAIK